MFTIKKITDRDGENITHGYAARSYEIVRNPNQRAVIAHLVNGESAYIPVADKGRPTEEQADYVVIENANGKTTDVVRA